MGNDTGRILANQGVAIEAVLAGETLPECAHPGLVFNRYLPLWKTDSSPEVMKDNTRVLSSFAAAFSASAAQEWLKVTHRRQETFCGRMASVRKVMKNTSSLAVGMGTDHPLEIGFLFDAVIGVPYLPGSAVKGLLRAAHKWGFRNEIEENELNHWLGSPADAEDKFRGELICLDVYPRSWPHLKLDVINCHHSAYYTQNRAPVETESPVPVFFLTVKDDTQWDFRFSSRSLSENQLERVIEVLTWGLDWLGIGAKTAVGYGRFESVEMKDAGEKWLESTLNRDELDTKFKRDEYLRSKALAEQWLAIDDSTLKKAALAAIRKKWGEELWSKPQGKSCKKAKAIYDGNIDQ